MPQVPVRTKSRLVPATSAGPPSGPFALRVSRMRHGTAVWKDVATGGGSVPAGSETTASVAERAGRSSVSVPADGDALPAAESRDTPEKRHREAMPDRPPATVAATVDVAVSL